MDDPLNCWEMKMCKHTSTCPATYTEHFDGINGGECGGRACWLVVGTDCDGMCDGMTLREKMMICSQCEVYANVKEEEGEAFLDHEDLPEYSW
jgi:hypothetical protein